ncbi:hypothetical protein F2Q68_00024791 [Brassica cretica]|uniref:Uncharacterized protein n=1 Tax=Brassica cretica TaxID=69181 RepID=A0A8S9I7V7_BRACR|nr:hypothetical protein F2Q68_00024791 [Brassica cretica]
MSHMKGARMFLGVRTDGREQRAAGKEHLTSKGSGEFEIGLYPWGHDDMQEDTWEFEIEITDQKQSIHMVKKSMEMWAKESNFGQAECLRVVDSYCEGCGAGSQYPNVDGNRVWNPGVLVVEENKSYSSVIAEKLWIAEILGSQKSLSSYGDVITVSVFGFWSLEDNAVSLPGSTLKFYGEKIVKQQQRYNTPLLLSAFTHGTFQSPRPPESLFSYCRKMNNDTERLESEEVTRNKTGRDGCSRKAWLSERQKEDSYLKSYGLLKLIIPKILAAEVKEVGVCLEMMFEADLMVKRQIIELPTKKSSSPPLSNDPYIVKADSSVMGCENRDVHIQLFVTVLATFWPVFELLSAVFEAESRAWINMYVISLKNTKSVRVTGSQTSDLLDDSLAMEFAIKSLLIVTLQVVDIHIKGVVSVVGDCIWTLNFTSVWFHSPRPPDICLSEQYRSWGILSKERAIALNFVVLTGKY